MSRTTLCCTLLSFGLGVSAFAQSFSGFTTGNIVVSRSVYAGSAATLAAGQPLPPVCPSTASCGTAPATASGAYITATSTNNVFNNNIVDGSFGVTSPIFLDQLTPTGTLVSTLPIPTSLVTTSFSSKSEVALNLSTDGTAITFMGYVTPPNTVDVSNANTPLAYDPTNPAGGTFYRAVVQVGANGAIMVTPSNSYSGNNGRAAILANSSHRPMMLNICNFLQPGQKGPNIPVFQQSAFFSYSFGPTSGTSWRTDTDVGVPGNVTYGSVLRNLDADGTLHVSGATTESTTFPSALSAGSHHDDWFAAMVPDVLAAFANPALARPVFEEAAACLSIIQQAYKADLSLAAARR